MDADNRLLWRKTPTRLDAETLRDTILSVCGQLNPQLAGQPYRDFKTFTNNSQFYEMIDTDSPDVYRRTIYRTWIRSGRNHLLDVFDCPRSIDDRSKTLNDDDSATGTDHDEQLLRTANGGTLCGSRHQRFRNQRHRPDRSHLSTGIRSATPK